MRSPSFAFIFLFANVW